MRKIRGLKLGKRISWISNWIFRHRYSHPRNHMILRSPSPSSTSTPLLYSSGPKSKPISKILTWGCRLKNRAIKSFCSIPSRSRTNRISRCRLSYVPLNREKASAAVPKGHLAIYVGGENDGSEDFQRVVVPIIYFNHPLFGELLKEAEKEYGFQHEGGITIPCLYSEFENVRSRIKSESTDTKLRCKRR